MPHRFVPLIGLVSTLLVIASFGGPATAQTLGRSKLVSSPRTAEARLDLQGTWSFATATPFERPAKFAHKAVLTDEDIAELEREAAKVANQDEGRQRGTVADLERAFNDFWYDFGKRAAATRQSSIVVDQPNGRIPELTADGRARADARAAARKKKGAADDPEDRTLAERCLIGFNAGPPLVPSATNNHIQIVQTPDYVMILNEAVRDARVVPLDGRPRLPPHIRRWQGDPRGRWEGDTLVVETTNLTEKNLPRGASVDVMLVERIWRTGTDTLMYEFTLTDPNTWTRPWTGRIPLERAAGEIYEYACHEGNYAMSGILTGARAEERRAAGAK